MLATECCEYCFKNSYIQNWIQQNGEVKNEECYYCTCENGYFIGLEEMGSYLREKINNAYMTQKEAYNSYGNFLANDVYQYDSLVTVLFDNDNFFSSEIENSNFSEQLLEQLLEESSPPYRDIANGEEDEFDEGIYTEIMLTQSDIQGEYSLNWSRFKYISKHVNRYFDMPQNSIKSWHSYQDGLAPDGKKESMLLVYKRYLEKMSLILPIKTSMYRARTFEPTKQLPHLIDESVCGPPPSNLARSMRMNPDGISYFYAAEDKETCLLEVRAKAGELVILGNFKSKKELKIVDFSNFPEELTDIFHPAYDHKERLELEFLEEFQKEISIPYDPTVSYIEYIPTQILTEYIRYLGYDGVKFKSSLSTNDSVNFLLFCGHAKDESVSSYGDLLPPKVTDWFIMNSHEVLLCGLKFDHLKL